MRLFPPLPGQKRRECLEAFGTFSGDNLFYFCNVLPPKSSVCLKSAIYYMNMLDQLIWSLMLSG